MAEALGPARGMASPPGSGMGFPIVRGDARRRDGVKMTEEVPSVGGALLYYVVRAHSAGRTSSRGGGNNPRGWD